MRINVGDVDNRFCPVGKQLIVENSQLVVSLLEILFSFEFLKKIMNNLLGCIELCTLVL